MAMPADLRTLLEKMRVIQRVAGQASVEERDPIRAEADLRFAEYAGEWADEIEAALGVAVESPEVNPEDHLDIYVPGVRRCLKCDFELTTATLFARSGDVGLTRAQALCEDEELCPNDGTPMVKVRWAERAQQNYDAYGALMNEIIGIAGLSRQCDNLPAALQILRGEAGQAPSAQESSSAARIPQDGWQPIETAPKDGAAILVFYPWRVSLTTLVVSWFNGDWITEPNHRPLVFPPTHWMPLPDPPSVAGTKDEDSR